jgi:hypothetical protein
MMRNQHQSAFHSDMGSIMLHMLCPKIVSDIVSSFPWLSAFSKKAKQSTQSEIQSNISKGVTIHYKKRAGRQ